MKKKIAVIGIKSLPGIGGAAAVVENLICQLHDEYDYTVYTLSSHTISKRKTKHYRQYVIKSFPFKRVNVIYYYFISALHAVLFGKYDLIHLHHIDGAFIILILRLRYKVISTSHGRPQTLEKWGPFVKKYFRFNEKIFLRFSDVVTSVSSTLTKIYEKESERQVYYIPNGIDVKTTNETLPEIREGNYILFAAARIISEKGCHHFLEALNIIQYKNKVLIIGDLDQTPGYKQKILDLSSNLNVKFIGLIKKKSLLLSYIKKADFFVFPSLQEAMSMILLEVASVKTPLICSDLPENKAIFNEDNVLFFRAGDAKDLASKLIFAVENPDILKKRSYQAYATLLNRYQWKNLANSYSDLYKRLINDKNKMYQIHIRYVKNI